MKGRREMSETERFVACGRKDAYSYAEARRIARHIRRQTHEPVHEYHCRDCKAWHVGQDRGGRATKRYLKRTRRRGAEVE